MDEHEIANGILPQMKLKSVPPLTRTLSVEIVILIKTCFQLCLSTILTTGSRDPKLGLITLLLLLPEHFRCHRNWVSARWFRYTFTMDGVPRWCLSNED